MSDTDSFIDEVSEEVRRDKLFRAFRKYGWIGIALVLVLVGGAAYNEWSKAKATARAQAFGDGVISALQLEGADERLAALNGIEISDDQAAIVGLLVGAEAVREDDLETAIAALKGVAGDAQLPQAYRHLAELKLVLMQTDTLSGEERILRLQPLAIAGAPYRLLAEEQLAIAEVDTGDTNAALERLAAVLADTEVSTGLRRRVSQLIVALGGTLDPA